MMNSAAPPSSEWVAEPDKRPGIGGVTPEALAAWFVERGQPAYRARQVLDAVWKGRETAFAEILTLPAPLRDDLEAAFRFDTAVRARDPRGRRRPDGEGAPPPRRTACSSSRS